MRKIQDYEIVRFGVVPEEYFAKSAEFLSYSQNNGHKYDIAYIGFGLTEVSALEDAIEQAVFDKWDIEEIEVKLNVEKKYMKRMALISEREDEGYWVGFSVRQVIHD